MGRKKNITKEYLITSFMNFVLENNHKPTSVYKFAKEHNFEEAHFYEYFGSFEAIEEAVFSEFFHHTMTTLSKSDEFDTFDARNKLLSFYFTFFEILTANRSYLKYALDGDLKKYSVLKHLKKNFTDFINTLEIDQISIPNEQIEKIQHKTKQESAWFQLLITLKFWLDDTSPSFEKTDIFIEKSVNAGFDLMDTTPLKNVIDFGKFILKEKVMFQ